MCESCINKVHDPSLIDPETKEIADMLHSKLGGGGPNPLQECPVAVAERDEAQEAAEAQESNLVRHAEQELKLAGFYDNDAVYGPGEIASAVLELVTTLSKQGHSGGSHSITMAVFNKVANFQNLKPLTDDPAEWFNTKEWGGGDFWQNIRRSDAFSADGGKTYYLLDGPGGKDKVYTSEPAANPGAPATRLC